MVTDCGRGSSPAGPGEQRAGKRSSMAKRKANDSVINGGKQQKHIAMIMLSFAISSFLGRSKMPMVDMQEGATPKQTSSMPLTCPI